MWVPGSMTFLLAMFIYVHRWLAPTTGQSEQRPGAARGSSRLATNHFRGSAQP